MVVFQRLQFRVSAHETCFDQIGFNLHEDFSILRSTNDDIPSDEEEGVPTQVEGELT